MHHNPYGVFMTPFDLKMLIVQSLDADKAEDIETIDLPAASSLADTIVVASGRSTKQVVGLADRLVERLHAIGHRPVRVEGKANGDWVIVDAGDIVVHLFRPEVRSFYNIERMWRADPLMHLVGTMQTA